MQEITADKLMEQCKEKLFIKIDNSKKAADVLSNMKIHNYSVIDNESIQVNGHILESGSINAALVNSGCQVYEIKIQTDSLEDYYFKLTGGVHNA